MTIKKNK